MLGAQQDAGHVDGEMGLPALQREVDEREGLRDAGVVHHDVAAAEATIDGIESRCDRRRVADVDAQCRGRQSRARERVGLLAGLGLVDVADQHVHALPGEQIRDGCSDTLGRAGDERDPLDRWL